MSLTDRSDTRKQEQKLKIVAKQLDELLCVELNLAQVDHCVCVALVGAGRDHHVTKVTIGTHSYFY